ncbi:VWA domain-containing protein [Caldisericum sp. AR60]|uniref:VWA domain-containing protein n=1 Tax=Caldisericum sp. AR60 TaxID=3397852 RepID=UPI0039FC1071
MKKILLLFIVLFQVFFLAPLAYSYNARISQIDKSKFPEIQLYVPFTDSNGNHIQSLSAENFSVKEEGKKVKIEKFVGSNFEQPITTILIIDRSGSMAGNKLSSAKQAAITFIDLLREQDESGIVFFSDSIDKSQITNNKTTLINTISSLQAGGRTTFYDATYEALQMLESVKGRKSIIALTDGMDNRSRYSAGKVIAKAKELNIPIYTIGLGAKGTQTNEGIDEESLKKIAEDTGGAYFYAPTYEELKELYTKILNQIMNEYCISYTSIRPTLDGTRREVEVTVDYQGIKNIVKGAYAVSGIIGRTSFRNIWLIFFPFLSLLVFLLSLPKFLLLRKKRFISEKETVTKPQKVIEKKASSASRVPENEGLGIAKKTLEETKKQPTSKVIAKLFPLNIPNQPPYAITKDITAIGSARENDIVLNDQSISPYPAKLAFEKRILFVYTLSEEGDIFVNFRNIPDQEHRVIKRNALKNNSLLRIGKILFKIGGSAE